MEYIADGKLLAVLDGANIQSLSLYGHPSFFSLGSSLLTLSHYQNGILHHLPPSLEQFDGKIEMTDLASEGCFVRHIETTRPLSFDFHISPLCHLYRYPDIKSDLAALPFYLLRIPAGRPCPDGSFTTSEQRLAITVIGDGELSQDLGKWWVRPGRTTLLCCIGTPGAEQASMEKHLARLDSVLLKETSFYHSALARYTATYPISPDTKYAFDVLTALQSQTGGVLAGHGQYGCLALDQALAGKAFLHAKKMEQANNIAKFLLSYWEKLDYIPLCMSADNFHSGSEPTGKERAYYPIIIDFFLDLTEKCREKALQIRLQDAILRLFSHTEKDLRNDLPDFSGSEFCLRKGALAPDRALYGNAVAGAVYLNCQQRIKSMPHISSLVSKGQTSKIAAHFLHDFGSSELPIIDSCHRIGRQRLPKAVYGTCAACRPDARYIGWLTRGKFDTYLCPRCYADGKREIIADPKPVILPGSYALSREMLRKADLIDHTHLCRSLEKCIRYEEETPQQVQFFELCRLAAVLRQCGDPHYHTLLTKLYTLLQKRRAPLSAAECAVYILAQNL